MSLTQPKNVIHLGDNFTQVRRPLVTSETMLFDEYALFHTSPALPTNLVKNNNVLRGDLGDQLYGREFAGLSLHNSDAENNDVLLTLDLVISVGTSGTPLAGAPAYMDDPVLCTVKADVPNIPIRVGTFIRPDLERTTNSNWYIRLSPNGNRKTTVIAYFEDVATVAEEYFTGPDFPCALSKLRLTVMAVVATEGILNPKIGGSPCLDHLANGDITLLDTSVKGISFDFYPHTENVCAAGEIIQVSSDTAPTATLPVEVTATFLS